MNSGDIILVGTSIEEIRSMIRDLMVEVIRKEMPTIEDRMISGTEAQAILAVSAPTLKKYVLEGKLISVRNGNRHPRYKLSDVMKLTNNKK